MVRYVLSGSAWSVAALESTVYAGRYRSQRFPDSNGSDGTDARGTAVPMVAMPVDRMSGGVDRAPNGLLTIANVDVYGFVFGMGDYGPTIRDGAPWLLG